MALDEHSLAQIRLFANSIQIAQVQAEFPLYVSDDDDLRFSDPPDACVIDFDRDPEDACRAARKIRELFPNTVILATSEESGPDPIVRAMRCGCSDYLLKPLDQHIVLRALSRLTAREGDKARRVSGQILTFIGAKGGCGTTFLTVHLAEYLAKFHRRKTLLIDYHPCLSDLSIYLALDKHRYHFRDLLDNTHRLDAQLVQGFVVRHASGLDVLSAPVRLEAEHQYIVPETVAHTFEFLRTVYEFVLVDCPPGLAPDNMAVVEESDQIYLVATPELRALQHAQGYLDELSRCRYDLDRVRVVINRDSLNGRHSADAAADLLARKIDWRIPNQYREVMRTINVGAPLRLTDEVGASLSRWAAALAGEPIGTPARAADAKRGRDEVLGLRTAEYS